MSTTLTTPDPPAPAAVPAGRLRRLCAKLGRWCDHLLDTHHARIPF